MLQDFQSHLLAFFAHLSHGADAGGASFLTGAIGDQFPGVVQKLVVQAEKRLTQSHATRKAVVKIDIGLEKSLQASRRC